MSLDGGELAQQRDYRWTVHLKMVKMVNFILGVYIVCVYIYIKPQLKKL